MRRRNEGRKMRAMMEIRREYGDTCAKIGVLTAQRKGLAKLIAVHLERLGQLDEEAAHRDIVDKEKAAESVKAEPVPPEEEIAHGPFEEKTAEVVEIKAPKKKAPTRKKKV